MCCRCSKNYPDIAGDNGPGRSRGDFGTKIHLATDSSGLPLNIVLSPGQAHESQFALRLLDGIGVQRQNGSMKRRGHVVLADKAYSGHVLRSELKKRGIKTVIPRKSNEKMAARSNLIQCSSEIGFPRQQIAQPVHRPVLDVADDVTQPHLRVQRR